MNLDPIQGPQTTLWDMIVAQSQGGNIELGGQHFRVVSGRADLSDIFILGQGVYNEMTYDAVNNYPCWYLAHNKAITFGKHEPVYPITYQPPAFAD
jgi:hypothetical protein